MKMKLPAPARRLAVNFGDAPVCLIPIRDGAHHTAEGRDEGWENVPILQKPYPSPFSRSSRDPLVPKLSLKTRSSKLRRGFTLVEILVVLVLLSLIVFALMAVFSGIQRAFKASLTQSDTLESGRAVMDLLAADLAAMAPVDWDCNYNATSYSPLGFWLAQTNVDLRFAYNTSPPSPLIQPLITSPSGAEITNVLEDFFMLSKGNINGVPSLIGTGYCVSTNLPDGTLYPLYRFYLTTPASGGPAGESALFNQFAAFQFTNSAVWSHLMDGVVNLTVRTYDTNGVWMTNGYADPATPHIRFARFNPGGNGEADCAFYSNAVPASVQVTLGTLEDHTLQHAEGLAGLAQSNYLSNAAGQVHLFRQRVWIRNYDPAAYQ